MIDSLVVQTSMDGTIDHIFPETKPSSLSSENISQSNVVDLNQASTKICSPYNGSSYQQISSNHSPNLATNTASIYGQERQTKVVTIKSKLNSDSEEEDVDIGSENDENQLHDRNESRMTDADQLKSIQSITNSLEQLEQVNLDLSKKTELINRYKLQNQQLNQLKTGISLAQEMMLNQFENQTMETSLNCMTPVIDRLNTQNPLNLCYKKSNDFNNSSQVQIHVNNHQNSLPNTSQPILGFNSIITHR